MKKLLNGSINSLLILHVTFSHISRRVRINFYLYLIPLFFQGRFEIVTLTGSYTYNEMGGVRRKVSLLSVQLATPEGRLFGGRVAGLLIAAGPTQVSFTFHREFHLLILVFCWP